MFVLQQTFVHHHHAKIMVNVIIVMTKSHVYVLYHTMVLSVRKQLRKNTIVQRAIPYRIF